MFGIDEYLEPVVPLFNSSANRIEFRHQAAGVQPPDGGTPCAFSLFEAVVRDDTNLLHTDIQVIRNFILALIHE
jgi:hypothetical protein